jgi:hypothetical protein
MPEEQAEQVLADLRRRTAPCADNRGAEGYRLPGPDLWGQQGAEVRSVAVSDFADNGRVRIGSAFGRGSHGSVVEIAVASATCTLPLLRRAVPVAPLAQHLAINRRVVGSSPTGGATGPRLTCENRSGGVSRLGCRALYSALFVRRSRRRERGSASAGARRIRP